MTADQSLGYVVAGDFIYGQLSTNLLQTAVISKEVYETIARRAQGTDDEKLQSRILALVFLIGKLPTEAVADTGIRATADILADLLVEDITAGSDALTISLWQRRPDAGLIVHSDCGTQYARKAYKGLLKANAFVGSVSRKGDCWDNAVAERFFASLKKERVQWRHYQPRAEAQQDILDYVVLFYNRHRLHSTLDYTSPNDCESAISELKKAA